MPDVENQKAREQIPVLSGNVNSFVRADDYVFESYRVKNDNIVHSSAVYHLSGFVHAGNDADDRASSTFLSIRGTQLTGPSISGCVPEIPCVRIH